MIRLNREPLHGPDRESVELPVRGGLAEPDAEALERVCRVPPATAAHELAVDQVQRESAGLEAERFVLAKDILEIQLCEHLQEVGFVHVAIRFGKLAVELPRILELQAEAKRIEDLLDSHVAAGPKEELLIILEYGPTIVVVPELEVRAVLQAEFQPVVLLEAGDPRLAQGPYVARRLRLQPHLVGLGGVRFAGPGRLGWLARRYGCRSRDFRRRQRLPEK